MVFATGGFHGLSYIKEQTFGTTPATPTMEAFRHTSCSLVLSKDSFQSAELRSDAQIVDMRMGANQVSGDIGIELSYGEYDDFLAAAVRGTWSENTLKAGTEVPYFTIERVFNDIKQYQVFKGCAVNTFNLSIQSNAIVTGTIGVVGKSSAISGTTIATSTSTSSMHSPLDSFSGALTENDLPIATITGIELNINNGINPAFVIGSPDAAALLPARINVSGRVSAYFSDLTLLNKFINEEESNLAITLGPEEGPSYKIVLPRIKYTGGSNAVSNEGAIQLDMPFQAVYDETEQTNITITRTPGA